MRSALKSKAGFDGPLQPINRLYDSVKFREFQQGQKRHTIMRSLFPQYKLPKDRLSLSSIQDRIR